jgi:tetratricopeptide (TPR) repeat protein
MADETDKPARNSDALLAAALGGAGNPKVEALLDRQVALADLQIEEMKREDRLRHWSLVVHHVSDVMKVTFEIALAAIALAILVVIGAAVWSAAHDNSLVIDAFSVPPDMAARGLTGQAVAAQLQDRLSALQDATDSARPADSYANNWGDDIKVQIPDTGVSVGEFYRMLSGWLGHQTHIIGEVYRDAGGIAITARAGGDGGATVSGSEADFDKLIQQSAEAIYARTQPYRYAVYGEFNGKSAEARAIFERLTVEGATPRERAWAYVGLSVVDVAQGDGYGAVDATHKAIAIIPDFALAWSDTDNAEAGLAHDEAALSAARAALRLLNGHGDVDMTPRARAITALSTKFGIDFGLDDFAAALQDSEEAARLPDYSGLAEGSRENVAASLAALHEEAAARKAWRDLPPDNDPGTSLERSIGVLNLRYWLGDWSPMLPESENARKSFEAAQAQHVFVVASLRTLDPRLIWPFAANAKAALGDLAGAHALIDRTPLDCLVCLLTRGRIDALERNWAGANYWFGHAVAFAPSIPQGYSDWGAMLLRKGDFDGAIAKFTLANRKGPHFADPLEMWGEALMAQNRSDLALAKFAEANKYAPNWGRLHLKWGEALLWSGQKDEAQKQFALVSHLDLSPSEKSELVRVETVHG